MSYGIQTWDGNGRPNNYGIRPVSVVDTVRLAAGQNTGQWFFDIPAGFKIGILQVERQTAWNGISRQFHVYQNSFRISGYEGGSFIMQATECDVVVFLERA